MEALIALIGGKLPLIGAGVMAVLAALATMLRFGFKAGSDSQKAKIGEANAKAVEDIARANRARADAERLPDDKYRRD